VVERAGIIIQNALAPDDPNVLPYLTLLSYPSDAKQSRVVLDNSKTAWEEVDDLAATAGLDYVTVGRRIILNDTHRSIGQLPEMRDNDFSDPPVVTEYGMQTCNSFTVTNNSGLSSEPVYPMDPTTGKRLTQDTFDKYYGVMEQLASAYNESTGGTTDALTADQRNKLIEAMGEQARRSIAPRWPTPVVVRVPDNSALNPDIHVGINQLVPGVWMPLRSSGTVRDVSQWQKLDSISVEETNTQEQVRVTMSPAPRGGDDDPDQDAAAAAEE
jgi:hypothetical protein